jgi:hypothetical protein
VIKASFCVGDVREGWCSRCEVVNQIHGFIVRLCSMRVEEDTFVRAMSWLIRAGLSFSITDVLNLHCVSANKKTS